MLMIVSSTSNANKLKLVILCLRFAFRVTLYGHGLSAHRTNSKLNLLKKSLNVLVSELFMRCQDEDMYAENSSVGLIRSMKSLFLQALRVFDSSFVQQPLWYFDDKSATGQTKVSNYRFKETVRK